MISIRQRSLLARIEGQLAMLASLARIAEIAGDLLPEAVALHWQRIEWAGKVLRPLLAAPEELDRFEHLFAEITTLRDVAIGGSNFLHRVTLLRADCVIWQLNLARERRQNGFIPHANEPHESEPLLNETEQ